jgi:Hemerythrin HHE cation binding domain
MTTPSTPPPDPFALLEQDHRDLDRLLDELTSAGSDEERQEVLSRLQQTLSVHFDFEESEVYPLVARLVGAPEADDRHAEDEAVREALGRLDPLPEGEPYVGAVEDLRTALAQHAEIETELFPRLREEVGIGEQEHLCASLLALREATL